MQHAQGVAISERSLLALEGKEAVSGCEPSNERRDWEAFSRPGQGRSGPAGHRASALLNLKA